MDGSTKTQINHRINAAESHHNVTKPFLMSHYNFHATAFSQDFLRVSNSFQMKYKLFDTLQVHNCVKFQDKFLLIRQFEWCGVVKSDLTPLHTVSYLTTKYKLGTKLKKLKNA